MNNIATLEKMSSMKLFGMSQAYRVIQDSGKSSDFTPDEMIAHLIDSEWDEKYNRKLARLLSSAKFRYQATIGEIDFNNARGLDKSKILRLSQKNWIKKGESVVISGATGTGKSFLASALGHQACINEFRVIYTNCLKIFSKLKFAKADGSYDKQIERLKRQDLIILDDFGIQHLDQSDRLALLEILEDRHSSKSTIFVSQIPIKKWHDIIQDQTIADAICDRVIHNAHIINLKGSSMRKSNNKGGSNK